MSEKRREELHRYAELSEWIKELSSPSPEGIESPQEYNLLLGGNYNRMRELNDKSTEILKNRVYPLLGEEDGERTHPLCPEEWEDLYDFCERLYDPVRRESVDDYLRYRVANRLLHDAEEKEDPALTIRALGLLAESCACMVMVTVKLYPESREVVRYRNEGITAAKRLLDLLAPEAFAALPDAKTREVVLKNARELWSLFAFRKEAWSSEENREHLRILREALALARDPFYIEQVSRYDWKNHRYRVLQGIGSLTEYHNAAGMDPEQLLEINACSRQLLALWKEDPVLQGALSSSAVLHLILYRNAYLAGELTLADYREALLKLMEESDDEDYTYDGNMCLVMTQTEYLLTLRGETLTREEQAQIKIFFDRLVRYVTGMPKLGSITALIVFLTRALDAFADCAPDTDFGDLCERLLAAINPPTYRHCMTASRLASCIASHLFDKEPSLLAEVSGYPDKEKVVSFIGRTALLHDSGKIWIAEAVTNYARGYFPEEEKMLLIYPEVSAAMLARFPDTAPCADIIRLHREERWDQNIATQIVSYADHLSRRPKEGDADMAVIPYIDALCREENTRADINRILDEESVQCATQILSLLRRSTFS